jgi:hypothetical protein
MYRQHIETPVSIPEDLQTDMDFLNGINYGRIYRIVPKKGRPAKAALPNLKNKQSAQLVELLASSNQWSAIQAQRLLLERQDVSIIPIVKLMFTTHKTPAARLHALYVLEGLNSLNASLVKQAVKDIDPNVRENGLILAERYGELMPLVLEATKDSIARVALQAVLSLGEFKRQQLMPAFSEVLQKRSSDPWFRTAVLSVNDGSSLQLLDFIINKGFFQEYTQHKVSFLEDFSYIVGFRNNPGEISQLLALVSVPSIKNENKWLLAALTGLNEGLKKLKTKPAKDPKLDKVLQNIQINSGNEIRDAVVELKKSLQQ